jgi:hypothetical protein
MNPYLMLGSGIGTTEAASLSARGVPTMTLRRMLGGDVQRIQEQIDDLLDREDGFIVLIDGSRMVTYSQGFGVSPCQLELLTVEIERAVRDVVNGRPTQKRRNWRNREKSVEGNNRGTGGALRQHLGRFGRGHHSGVVDGGSESVRSGDATDSHSGSAARSVLRLAGNTASWSPGRA